MPNEELDDATTPSLTSSTSYTKKNTKTYIVTFDDDDDVPPATRCATLAESVGGTVDRVYSYALKGCSLIVPMAPEGGDQQIQQAVAVTTTLNETSFVMTIEEDQVFFLEPTFPPDDYDTEIVSQVQDVGVAAAKVPSWGLDRINQCTHTLDGKVTKQDADGVTVFVVDTGIRGDHVEFTGQLGNDCHWSAFPNVNALTDTNGHG